MRGTVEQWQYIYQLYHWFFVACKNDVFYVAKNLEVEGAIHVGKRISKGEMNDRDIKKRRVRRCRNCRWRRNMMAQLASYDAQLQNKYIKNKDVKR